MLRTSLNLSAPSANGHLPHIGTELSARGKRTHENKILLKAYSWPGNVRELQNVIERALILSSGRKLELSRAMPQVDGGEQAENVLAASTSPQPARVLSAVFALVFFVYCPMARIISLLRGNRTEPMSLDLLGRTFLTPPAPGNIHHGLPAAGCPGGACALEGRIATLSARTRAENSN